MEDFPDVFNAQKSGFFHEGHICRGSEATLNCQSCAMDFTTCSFYSAYIIHKIEIIKVMEGSCKNGLTYGFNKRTVWTDKGCKAQFKICYEEGKYQDIMCESGVRDERIEYQPKEVKTICDVMLIAPLGVRQCRFEKNWGFIKDHVWVSEGCEGQFRVYY